MICRPILENRPTSSRDNWWDDVQPLLVNENVVGPKMNPMKEIYWKQIGGGPTEQMLKRMDPTVSAEEKEQRKQNKRKKKDE